MWFLLQFIVVPLEFKQCDCAHFWKINLLEAYNTINKFDVICLSESYIDPSITSDNNDLDIKGYNLYISNHPNNVKRGGVCMYIRGSLPIRCISDAYLQECLMLEILFTLEKRVILLNYIDSLVNTRWI